MSKSLLNSRFLKDTKKLISLLFFLILCTVIVHGQNRNELEKQRTHILNQIKLTEKFLAEATQKKKSNIDDLKAIEAQILYRERLLSLLTSEIKTIEIELKNKQTQYEVISLEYDELVRNYGELLQWALIKKESENPWIKLLFSKNLNESLIAWKFFDQLKSHIKRKSRTIKKLKEELADLLLLIEARKKEKEKLLSSEESHIEALQVEKELKDELQKELLEEEDKFKLELKSQQKFKEHLSKAIEKIIEDEIAARERALKNKAIDPAIIELNASFSQNKGKLPWPVKEAIVSQRFGNQRHPSLRNVTISNNGLDLRANKNAAVYAVFEGEVVGNMAIPGHDNMLMIKHGNYYSVYSRLSDLYVSTGDRVSTNQKIGRLSINENENSILHFELWDGKEKVDPEIWLFKN